MYRYGCTPFAFETKEFPPIGRKQRLDSSRSSVQAWRAGCLLCRRRRRSPSSPLRQAFLAVGAGKGPSVLLPRVLCRGAHIQRQRLPAHARPRGGGCTISGGRGRRRKLRRQIILPELYSCSSSLMPRRFWRGILGEKDSDIWRRQGRKDPLGYRRQNDQVGPQKPVQGRWGFGSNTQLQTHLVHMPVGSILEQSVGRPPQPGQASLHSLRNALDCSSVSVVACCYL